MKPRLRVRYGIWCCVSWHPFVCGCGRAPAEAYAEWRAQFHVEHKHTEGRGG